MSAVAKKHEEMSVDLAACQIHELTAGMDSLIQATQSPECFRACLNNPIQLNVLVRGIGAFVAVDARFQTVAQKVGKVLENLLAQEEDEQREFVRALCAAQSLSVPQDKDGRTRVGRAGLVHALFGAHPGLLERSGKDTLAGKRFNYYLRQARDATTGQLREDFEALQPLRVSPAPPGTPDGTVFREMWAAADDEQRVLLAQIAEKAKLPVKRWRRECEVVEEQKRRRRSGDLTRSVRISKATIFTNSSHVTPETRVRLLNQLPVTVWFTGFSGSGKSTLAFALEAHLLTQGHICMVLDGDTTRHVLSPDLGFSAADRAENIRRTAATARLINDAGMIVITSFISPYSRDREMAKGIIGDHRFLEVYLSADLSTCEERDPKGLYAKARLGAIRDFTGVSAPYEAPSNAALVLDTGARPINECVKAVMDLLAPRLRPAGHKQLSPSQ